MPQIELGYYEDGDTDGLAVQLNFENTLEGNESAKMVFYGLKSRNVHYMILTPEKDNVVGLAKDQIWFEE